MSLDNCVAIDFGTSITTARVYSNGHISNPLSETQYDNYRISAVLVSRNDIKCCGKPKKTPKGSVWIRNIKKLLGKMKSDLSEDMLKEEIYGAKICFDEYDRPYFHCNLGDEDKDEEIYRDVYPEEALGAILKAVKEQACGRTENSIASCCFTIPHFATHRARRLMRDEARKLGMNCIFMIKEPTAAGIPFLLPEMKGGYGDCEKDVQEGDCILVFDIGGGTLDITIIRREGNKYQVIGNGGSANIGGNDIDKCIFDYAVSWYEKEFGHSPFNKQPNKQAKQQQMFLMNCCEAKVSLSSNMDVDLCFPENNITLSDMGEINGTSLQITRDVFEKDIILPILQQCSACWREVLEANNLVISDIQHILLVGGPSNIPAIQNLFPADKILNNIANKQMIVVEGALQAVLHNIDENDIEEMMEADIGVMMTSADGQEEVFQCHIPRGMLLPTYVNKHHVIEFTNDKAFMHIYRNMGNEKYCNEGVICLAQKGMKGRVRVDIQVHIQVGIDGALHYTIRDLYNNLLGVQDIILS